MGARLGVVDSHDSTEELSYSNSAKKSNFSISKGQRESLGLINIGTFLEYFDFKVYSLFFWLKPPSSDGRDFSPCLS
jgi:hypothetical protein